MGTGSGQDVVLDNQIETRLEGTLFIEWEVSSAWRVVVEV